MRQSGSMPASNRRATAKWLRGIRFSWFSLAITSYVGGERSTNDWRIDSRSDSLAAFAQGIAKPEADFLLIPAD